MNTLEAFDKLVEMDRAEPRRVLILGDGMTDVYVHGTWDWCQEDCPKFIEEKRVCVPGGAANAAESMTHWFVTRGLFINDFLKPVKTRFMDGDRCIFRHDIDNNRYNIDTRFQSARDEVLGIIRSWNINAVLISDYEKGFLTPTFIREVIDGCNERRIPVVADVKSQPAVYIGAIIKCNNDWYNKYHKELVHWRGTTLVRTFGGATPDIYYTRGSSLDVPSKPPVHCVNHVGAGDCFASHMVLSLAYGLSIYDAVTIAYSAGRVYVQHPYNRAPRPEEIREDLQLT